MAVLRICLKSDDLKHEDKIENIVKSIIACIDGNMDTVKKMIFIQVVVEVDCPPLEDGELSEKMKKLEENVRACILSINYKKPLE